MASPTMALLLLLTLLTVLGSGTTAPAEAETEVTAAEQAADYHPSTWEWSVQCFTANANELVSCGPLGVTRARGTMLTVP